MRLIMQQWDVFFCDGIYLRLTGCRLGLLINFGENMLKDGFKRVVNGLEVF